MKRILTLAVALCLLCTLGLFAVSCSSGDVAPEGMQNAAAVGEGFLFYVPESWQSQANSGVSAARYGNNEDKSNVSMTKYVPNTAEEGTPEHYWVYFLKPAYEKQFVDFAVMEDGNGVDVTLGGRSAKKYVFTATFGGVAYKYMQVIAQGVDANTYIFTYTAKPEFFDAHLEEVATMLTEFRFG